MKHLFQPGKLGGLTVANRLVHSATYEGMASETGEVTDELVKRYRTLAKGEIGLIIAGYLYVHPSGRALKWQTGIYSDKLIPGLKRVTDAVHQHNGKIVFQLNHAGRQTTPAHIGSTPMAPLDRGRDPVYLVKPRRMNEKDITRVVAAFGEAAARAVAAGADGIQLHAAHGYLINQFLSPYFNRRNDAWGGSDEKRFRFLKAVAAAVRKEMPNKMPLLVKLNAMDYTPRQGITPPLAAVYAGWLADLGIDGIEVSCGTASYSFMNLCRGEVPVKDMVAGLPLWKRPFGWLMLNNMQGKFDLEEGYNLGAAIQIKAAMGKLPLLLVGGIRRISQMEEILEKGQADFISMSRPFIREPLLAKKFKEGKQNIAECISCNRCLAAAANGQPVRCYYRGAW